MNKIKKMKFKYIILFILILICSFSIGLTNSRYTSSKKIGDSLPIAKPILEFEPVSNSRINDMLPGQMVTYDFNIKNTDGNITNEVLINYYIKVTCEDNNLPITYKIYDITDATEEEVTVTSEQTSLITLGYKEIENHKYRIKFTWLSSDKAASYADKQTEFNIEVYAEQAIN